MRIAIVKLSALGDIVQAMVVLQFIKTFNQKIVVDWFVEESYKELLVNHPHVNEVYVLNFKKVKRKKSLFMLLDELSKVRHIESYDVVIDMQGLIKSAIVSRLIPSEKTFGFDKKSIRESLAARFYTHKIQVDYAENIIKRNIILISKALELSNINNSLIDKKPYLFSDKNYFIKSGTITKHKILLIPGASFETKSYPIEKFAKFANKIDANFFVIWGNNNEKLMVKKLQSLSSNVQIIDKLPLNELISFISQMNLVVGSDTGPTHIAWALNVPSITLFGPTPGPRNSFETSINKYIESNSKVNPLKINKNDQSIKHISVEDIVKMARYLLKVN